MTANPDNSNSQRLAADIAKTTLIPPRNPVLTAPLPDPITKNIEAIASLHSQEARDLPAHQQLLEAVVTFFGRSAFLYGLLVALTLWILGNLFKSALPFAIPPFTWAGQGLDAAALLISTGVLVRQTRQENFAEQRAQLTLQFNLLSEQKIAKIITLLEELRIDLPNVTNRHDPEAAIMQQAADPIAVLEALQQSLTQQLLSSATESATDSGRSLKSEPHAVVDGENNRSMIE